MSGEKNWWWSESRRLLASFELRRDIDFNWPCHAMPSGGWQAICLCEKWKCAILLFSILVCYEHHQRQQQPKQELMMVIERHIHIHIMIMIMDGFFEERFFTRSHRSPPQTQRKRKNEATKEWKKVSVSRRYNFVTVNSVYKRIWRCRKWWYSIWLTGGIIYFIWLWERLWMGYKKILESFVNDDDFSSHFGLSLSSRGRKALEEIRKHGQILSCGQLRPKAASIWPMISIYLRIELIEINNCLTRAKRNATPRDAAMSCHVDLFVPIESE